MKKILWESWNAKEDEIAIQRQIQQESILNSLSSQEPSSDFQEAPEENINVSFISQPIITPFGISEPNSPFKPTDRWEIWIGNTNFKVTQEILNTLNEETEGIEALSVLGTYTFCIGIPKAFTASEVKRNIESKLIGELNDRNRQRDDGGSLE